MPTASAKPRPRRLVLPPLTDGQQVLFTFDEDFPNDQRKPEAEKVLAARRRGKSTRVVVPIGMHVYVRARRAGRLLLVDGRPTFVPSTLAEVGRGKFPGGPAADLPAPLKITTGKRGQPPKTPAGTWEDHPELFKAIEDILDDADDRADRLTEIHVALCRLAREFLGPERFAENECEKVLKSLARKTIRPAGTSRPARVGSDEIERQFLVWRYNLTDPAVRKIRLPRKPKPVAHDSTALVLTYQAEQPLLDENGKPKRDKDRRPIPVRPPVCDNDGRPILWVTDEHGQPSRPYGVLDEHGQLRPYVVCEPLPRRRVKAVRPPVKMTFR